MKRKLILGLAATASVAVLAATQLTNAQDTKPGSTTPPATEQAASKPDKDKGGRCEKFGDRGHRGGPDKFRRFHGDRGHRGPGMMHDLNLSPEQKEKVKAVMEANKPKFEAIRKEMQAKMQAAMDETQKEIRPILTPAQQKVLDDAAQLRASQRALREDAAAAKKAQKSE